MSKWAVPFPAGWSGSGDIDTAKVGTGSEWDGNSELSPVEWAQPSGLAINQIRSGAIITPGPYVGEAGLGGVLDSFSPGTGWGWVYGINAPLSSDTMMPLDYARTRLARMGQSRGSNDHAGGLGYQGSVPDWRGLAAYAPTVIPPKATIKGIRLALHVRGAPWVGSGIPAVVRTPIPTDPNFNFLEYGLIPIPLGIDNVNATILIVVADTVDALTLTNVTILKKLKYHSSTGHVTASVPSDSTAGGPPVTPYPESNDFYWGYVNWAAMKSTTDDKALQPTCFNMTGGVAGDYWYTAPLDTPGTTDIGPSPPATWIGPSGPENFIGPTRDLDYILAGGITDPINFTIEPFDIDLGLDYKQVAGRSVFIVYPAFVPWASDEEFPFWVGFDSVSNSDAMFASGLASSAGQIEIEMPDPGAKPMSAIPDISDPDVPGVIVHADYWIPAAVNVEVDNYIGPGTPWLPGDPYFGGGRGQPRGVELHRIFTMAGTDDPYTIDSDVIWFEFTGPNIKGTYISRNNFAVVDADPVKPWLGHAAAQLPEFEVGGPVATPLQLGKTYSYRMVARYRAIDDDVVQWDMARFHDQLGGGVDYPWHWVIFKSPWAEFTVPTPPRSTVVAGPQSSGLLTGHRNVGHSGDPVNLD